MVSVCRSFGENFVVSWWIESLECRRVICPESRFVGSVENTINSLTVGGCSKTPPSRSGVSELRHYDRTEHLLQGRLRHPMRPQDPDGVHGPCRRADDIIQVYLSYNSSRAPPTSLLGTDCLQSSATDSLFVPAVRLSTVGRRTFPVAGACIWSDLPSDVTSSPSLFRF